MEKEMFEININTDEGKILLTQPYPMSDVAPIIIDTGQVDILIKWLKEAKAEYADNTKD